MNNNIVMQNKFVVGAALAIALILTAQLVAMQFTDGANWSWFDFAAATVLLLGSAGVLGLATSAFRRTRHKALVGIAVLGVVLVLWVELAVGLVGSPIAGS